MPTADGLGGAPLIRFRAENRSSSPVSRSPSRRSWSAVGRQVGGAWNGPGGQEGGFAETVAAELGGEFERDEAERVEAGQPAAPTLYVGLDGTGVPVRKAEAAGRVGKQADGSAKTREVELVTVWSAEGRDPHGAPRRDADSVSCNAAVESIAAQWGKARRDELDRHGAGPVIAGLQRHARRCDKARKELDYFAVNRGRMDYPGPVRHHRGRRGRLQVRRRQPPQTRRHALVRRWRQRHHRLALRHQKQPLRRLLGTPGILNMTPCHKSDVHPCHPAGVSKGTDRVRPVRASHRCHRSSYLRQPQLPPTSSLKHQ